ncbi:hypothetical protein MJ904_01715 [Massilia sp. MB5]|uniref:hypothetical protein n=1 Tax=Massilia sp. MB5 TaxID=2919578 RepID=UPI001F0D4AAB|nr:hypothetical protein [Massilia sp. MB5]UMR31012.1 hypothetical protein MJ904_01715 [Massilia sp. MB5]
MKADDVDSPTFVGNYAITRLKNSGLVMPNEGLASFKLALGEAAIQRDGSEVAGQIDAGRLNVDFASKRFTTGLTVSGGGGKWDVAGTGVITEKGLMYSDSRSNTLIRGFLGGSRAEQAGYIFKNTSIEGTTIIGATLWNR